MTVKEDKKETISKPQEDRFLKEKESSQLKIEQIQKISEEAKRTDEEVRQNYNFLKKVHIGAFVKFGNYPQGADGDIRPIEWQLLAKKGNRILLISRYGLDARRFDGSSNNWKNSEIRQWLNSDFYNKAFNENEKKLIRYTKKKVGFWESLFGQSDLTKLIDVNIFLLSEDELYKYFPYKSSSRKCKATEYAVKNGANVADNGYSWWWLRSSFPVGMYGVFGITADGNYFDYPIGSCIGVVRPALLINL